MGEVGPREKRPIEKIGGVDTRARLVCWSKRPIEKIGGVDQMRGRKGVGIGLLLCLVTTSLGRWERI